MPVYEFYCPDCHAIYSFFSRRVDTETRPACPSCARPDLSRHASLFAISSGRGDSDGDSDEMLPAGLDEEKLMKAFASMSGDMEHLEGEDPKLAAAAMRKLFDATGLKLGDGMAEAIRRLEAGEDPDQIDAEMGDALSEEDPFATSAGQKASDALKKLRRDLLPPSRDDTWYPLQPPADGAASGD